MIILITGVAGFIGTNYANYHLRNHTNHRIIGLDKLTYAGNMENLKHLLSEEQGRFTFIKGDINDKKLVENIFSEHGIDIVINFAAETHVDRSIMDSQVFLKTNVLGTHTLLDVCKGLWVDNGEVFKGKRFIQISTDEVYGSLGPTGYFTEITPLNPHSPYSASKASADLIVKVYYDTHQLPVNIARCSNNYGPYQFPEKLIPLMIYNALRHEHLPVYGDGKQIRDWLHVDDHCRAIDFIMKNGRNGEIYNIGGHNERENIIIVKKIVELLQEKTGDQAINETLIKYVKDRPGHDRRYGIDPAKLMNELGWKSEIKFEDGLSSTIDWYLANRAWMKNIISGDYLDYYRKNYEGR
ncbi:MAG: dTDP-glucose 4,6-dehydratase [Candidatus Odinarchaeota archaeon]